MNAAFQFLAAPTAGTQIVRIVGDRGAWLAADARIAAVVLRQVADLVCGGVFPDLAPSPIGERANFGQRLAGGQAVKFRLLQVFARGRLFAAQSGEPCFVRAQRVQERIDLAELAAFRGIVAIHDAKSGFLRGDRLFWNGVDQVEIPFTRNRVAEFVCFGEVISRFEKKHRNRWDTFAEKMQDDHVFGLEAACEASAVRIGAGERLVDNFLSGAPVGHREVPDGRLQLLFAGRLERRKGADVLIEALSGLDSEVDWYLPSRLDDGYACRWAPSSACARAGPASW